MWKRDNEPAPTPQSNVPAQPTARREEPEPVAPKPAPSSPATRALLGPSIEFHGEIAGGEDLLIEGRFKGKVRLPQHAVAIGTKGHVTAEIQARILEIEGEVEGQLQAEELIVLHKSARVRGDLVAPRVVLEDGAKFKGSIDMEPKAPAATGRARGDVEARSEKPGGATSPPSSAPAATGSAAPAPRPS